MQMAHQSLTQLIFFLKHTLLSEKQPVTAKAEVKFSVTLVNRYKVNAKNFIITSFPFLSSFYVH